MLLSYGGICFVSDNLNNIEKEDKQLSGLKKQVIENDIKSYDRIVHHLKEVQDLDTIMINGKIKKKEAIEYIYLYAKYRYVDDSQKLEKMIESKTDLREISLLNEAKGNLNKIERLNELNHDEVTLENMFKSKVSNSIEELESKLNLILSSDIGSSEIVATTIEVQRSLATLKTLDFISYRIEVENELKECLTFVEILIGFDEEDEEKDSIISKLKGLIERWNN